MIASRLLASIRLGITDCQYERRLRGEGGGPSDGEGEPRIDTDEHGRTRIFAACIGEGGQVIVRSTECGVLRGCDFIATDLESVVLAPLHYSETTGTNAFDVVHKRGDHRDELGSVKKSHARSSPALG